MAKAYELILIGAIGLVVGFALAVFVALPLRAPVPQQYARTPAASSVYQTDTIIETPQVPLDHAMVYDCAREYPFWTAEQVIALFDVLEPMARAYPEEPVGEGPALWEVRVHARVAARLLKDGCK
jgi:hypothetical protein